ncbi:MAG: hypothetical protein ACFHW5_09150 [Verrucomicrobiota bacterium]
MRTHIIRRCVPVLAVCAVLLKGAFSMQAEPWVVYEGDSGPGKGKHILFIASDHEYRGEESCPAIARILAKRYGFKNGVKRVKPNLPPETGFLRCVSVV